MGRRNQEFAAILERQRTGPIEDPMTLPPGEQFLTRGVLLQNRRKIVTAAVVLLVVASLLSYFIKPKAPMQEIVSPAQELSGYAPFYPGSNELAKRVTSSYNLAFVLMGSPYTAKSVQSLENIRSWAQRRFQAQPDFLHPISISAAQEPNDTVIGALGYNLFASVRYGLESTIGSFLSWRIAEFHKDPSYLSFSNSYFEIYGRDFESATLLARFQSDKAKNSIDVILWSVLWSIVLGASALYVTLSPRSARFDRIRHSLIATWALIAIAYGGNAWMQNSIPSLMSALLATSCCSYFVKPFVLLTRPDSSLKVFFIQLSSRWIALSVWATYSLLAITMLTWIRCTYPDTTDPMSLLLSGLSGDFLHDPEDAKRVVSKLIGTVWLLISLWAFLQKDKDAKLSDQLEAELASL